MRREAIAVAYISFILYFPISDSDFDTHCSGFRQDSQIHVEGECFDLCVLDDTFKM
jgi:hypothetical protein